jgi:hypothetical protein
MGVCDGIVERNSPAKVFLNWQLCEAQLRHTQPLFISYQVQDVVSVG